MNDTANDGNPYYSEIKEVDESLSGSNTKVSIPCGKLQFERDRQERTDRSNNYSVYEIVDFESDAESNAALNRKRKSEISSEQTPRDSPNKPSSFLITATSGKISNSEDTYGDDEFFTVDNISVESASYVC